MNLTETEQRIYDLLADGMAHQRRELEACLWDEFGEDKPNSITFHLANMRKKLGRRGLDITCRGSNGSSIFRLVRFISQDN